MAQPERKPYIEPITQKMFVTTFDHAKMVEGVYINDKGELRRWINNGIRTGGYLIDETKWLLPIMEEV